MFLCHFTFEEAYTAEFSHQARYIIVKPNDLFKLLLVLFSPKWGTHIHTCSETHDVLCILK